MKITDKKLRELIREEIRKETRKLMNEKREYKLIDYSGKEVRSFDYHGHTYEVVHVYDKDSVIAIGPNGKEVEIDIDEIKDQDDDIKGIK